MRAFIAIELDDSIKRGLAKLQENLRSDCPHLRWVRPEQIHLTLAFLGEIKDAQIEPISQAVAAAAAATPDFDFAVEGLGLFPSHGRVNVVWAGVKDAAGELAECHRILYERLADLGFAPDRGRFSPHLTLARVKSKARRDGDPRASHNLRETIAAYAAPRLGPQAARRLTFFESILGAAGPQHRPLSHHNFELMMNDE